MSGKIDSVFCMDFFFVSQRDEHNNTVRRFDSESALFGPHLPKGGFYVSGNQALYSYVIKCNLSHGTVITLKAERNIT